MVLKGRGSPADDQAMSPVSPDAPVAVLVKAKEQMQQEGRNAVRLIEAAQVQPAPLPPNATFSIRV
jgi:hypothetical protein